MGRAWPEMSGLARPADHATNDAAPSGTVLAMSDFSAPRAETRSEPGVDIEKSTGSKAASKAAWLGEEGGTVHDIVHTMHLCG